MRRPTLPNMRTFILVATAFGIVAAAGLFVARGWIRGPLVQKYVETVYLNKIDRHFEADFKDIDPKMAALGLPFNEHYTSYFDADGECHEPMYELLSISTYCHKTHFNNESGPKVDDSYRQRWLEESPALERYLFDTGWTKTWNAAQPIDELLIRDDRGQSVGVNYIKSHGKITCNLSIWYNGSVTEQERNFIARKSCSRNIEFFGGY